MKAFLYFCLIMIVGFLILVPWLLFVVPLMGLKTFIILLLLIIFGFFVEILCK
ncbi:hypothetical protein SAMN05216179_0579 [Gracilibacillus kekensis]|uniref:Uncharacterized protein n=1 Tax=Gracilibacillus kekensis TaxID=1027249 RepID=A0A1M7K503_9BACI|nr:hypothetical protein SAMN05216179_0579 [Gracilibacillus kekensis]